MVGAACSRTSRETVQMRVIDFFINKATIHLII